MDVPREIKTLSPAFCYSHSALGRIEPAFFTSTEGVQTSPTPCILPDLALSSCLKAALWEEPHRPAVDRLSAGHSGTSPKEL